MSLLLNAKDLKLDSVTGDLVIENGDLVLVADADALTQTIRTELQLFQGEWFLDESAGMPYYQSILVKNPSLSAVREIFRKKILSIPGVNALLSIALQFDGATRALSVSFRVDSDFGALALGVVI